MELEEYQNKENENPQKDPKLNNEQANFERNHLAPEEDVLYAQVNARLEPDGASRDTENEADKANTRNTLLTSMTTTTTTTTTTTSKNIYTDDEKLYGYSNLGIPYDPNYIYSIPKSMMSNNTYQNANNKMQNPEELYAAINKSGLRKKGKQFPVPEETWEISEIKKNLYLQKVSDNSFSF